MTPLRVVALLSGGKDSLFNMHLATTKGHQIVAIANLKPPDEFESDELDSYMYQTVGHQAIESIAQALERPLFRTTITGSSKNKDLNYKEDGTQEDEVEQLYSLLLSIRDEHNIQFDAVSVGAVASSYQKSRVENICQRLGVKMLAYLWNMDQDELLQEMINNSFHAILIKVACIGLDDTHLGQSIKQMQDYLRKLNKAYNTNICGEGGEYETLVLDCPLYKRRLVMDSCVRICHSKDMYAPVYYMRPLKITLADKV